MSMILSLLRRLSYGLALLLSVLNAGSLQAQKKSASSEVVGHYLYEKLINTQKEYNQALAKGDSLEVAEMCYLLGKRYIGLGDFETAQKYFFRSLRIREPLGPSEAIGKVYIFMSYYQVEQKKYVAALQMVRRAMANFSVAGSRHGLMSGYLAVANVHALGYNLNQNAPGTYPHYSFDSALHYFQQAEKLALLLKAPYDVANIYYNEGTFLLKSDFQRGLVYLKKADAIFASEKSPYAVINTSLAVADALLTVHQPVASGKWLTRAQYVMDSARLGDYKQQSKLLQTYSQLYEHAGNWQDALTAQKKFHALTVEALKADREGAITRLGLDYETQQKQAQLEWQQRFSQVVIGVCLIAIIASIVFYRFYQRYKQLSQRNADLVMEQNHRVKNNFQQVINLLTLQSNRLTNTDAQKAVTEGLLRIEAMSLVQQRLYDGDRLVEINLRQFIPELVEGVLRSYNYAAIQLVCQVEPIWLHADQAVPLGLIINELVTNACKYAFPGQREPLLQVACQQTDKAVSLVMTDNGPGFEAAKNRTTFGLNLIEAFTQDLNGQARFVAAGNTFQLSFPIHPVSSIRSRHD